MQPGWPPGGYPPPQHGYGPPGYPMAPVPHAPMFRCNVCGSTAPPLERSKISTAGWVLFGVLLVFCFPLFWIGLLQKQKYRVCAHCNANLGNIG